MNLRKEFYRSVLPSMLAFALSGVYAVTDGFFVGHALGDQALAAINIAFPLTAFLQAVGTGAGMGGAVSYTLSMGSGDQERARQYFGLTVVLLPLLGLLLTGLFLGTAPAVLRLFGASGAIYDLAWEYIRFVTYGAIFQVLGTGLVPLIRNMGGSVTAMAAMVAGFCANIFLDYLLVWRIPLGMMGAAMATALGQAATFAVCLGFFLVKRMRPLLRWDGRGRALLRRVAQVGLSPFGLTFSPNLALILVNKSAVVVGGDPAVTCYATISYISSVILLLLQGVSDGSQPLLSLLCGQDRQADARQVRGMAYRFALVLALACMVVLFLLRGETAALFGASPRTARDVAACLPLFLLGYPFAALSRVTTAYCYATGADRRAYLLIYGEPLLLAVGLLVLPVALGVWGTWAAVPLSQALTAAFSAVLLLRERRE